MTSMEKKRVKSLAEFLGAQAALEMLDEYLKDFEERVYLEIHEAGFSRKIAWSDIALKGFNKGFKAAIRKSL